MKSWLGKRVGNGDDDEYHAFEEWIEWNNKRTWIERWKVIFAFIYKNMMMDVDVMLCWIIISKRVKKYENVKKTQRVTE